MVAGVRLPVAILLAGGVVFFLFRLMHLLIAMTEMRLDEDRDRARIEFVRLRQDSQAQQRKRELPQKQRPQKPPETPEIDQSESTSPGATSVAVSAPTIETGVEVGKLSLTRPTDGEEVPVVRVEPMYPRRAAEQFIEGWVTLKFDVTTTGATANVKVIDSKPKRIFDRAAVRAVSKWKYKPKVIDGKPQVKKGLTVRLTFKLN